MSGQRSSARRSSFFPDGDFDDGNVRGRVRPSMRSSFFADGDFAGSDDDVDDNTIESNASARGNAQNESSRSRGKWGQGLNITASQFETLQSIHRKSAFSDSDSEGTAGGSRPSAIGCPSPSSPHRRSTIISQEQEVRLDDLESRIEELETENEQLRIDHAQQIENLVDEHQLREQEVSRLEEKSRKLHLDIANLEEHVFRLQEKVATLETENSQLLSGHRVKGHFDQVRIAAKAIEMHAKSPGSPAVVHFKKEEKLDISKLVKLAKGAQADSTNDTTHTSAKKEMNKATLQEDLKATQRVVKDQQSFIEERTLMIERLYEHIHDLQAEVDGLKVQVFSPRDQQSEANSLSDELKGSFDLNDVDEEAVPYEELDRANETIDRLSAQLATTQTSLDVKEEARIRAEKRAAVYGKMAECGSNMVKAWSRIQQARDEKQKSRSPSMSPSPLASAR